MSEKDNRQDFLQLLKEQEQEQEALDPEFSSLIGDSIGEIKTLVQDKVEKSSSLIDKKLAKARQEAAVRKSEDVTDSAS